MSEPTVRLRKWILPALILNMVIGVPCSIYLPKAQWEVTWAVRFSLLAALVLASIIQERKLKPRTLLEGEE